TLIDGGFISGNAFSAHSINTSKMRTGSKRFVQNIPWAITAYNRVSWNSGSIKWADGTSTPISAGNTGFMTQNTYVYYSGSSSLVSTTNYKDTVGDTKVLLAAIIPGLSSNEKP